MNLRCLVGLHDWENVELEWLGREVIAPRCCRCRLIDWQKAKHVPDRVVPAERTTSPPEVIRKGGMGEKPAGAPAKDPNEARSGVELMIGVLDAYGPGPTRAEQMAEITAWCAVHGGRLPTLQESLGIPADWPPSPAEEIRRRVAGARRRRLARRW